MLKPDVLRKKEDFTSIYKRERSVPSKFVVVFYRKNHLPYNRKAFLASKKVGKAYRETEARRLMKEATVNWRNSSPGVGFHLYRPADDFGFEMCGCEKSMEAAIKERDPQVM